MKRIVILALFIVTLTAGYSFADREGHMMGGQMGSPGYGQSEKSGEYGGQYGMMGPGMMGGMMGPGMMGYGGYGMMGPRMMGYGGCDMMNYGGYGMMGGMMGPGMMGHMRGMMGPGMMGPGMMGMMGPGIMGGYGMGPGMMGYGAKDYQKFLDDTRSLRRELNNKKFEYFEAARMPDTKREDLEKIQKEMWELQEKIYNKWRK
jgi:hypothetical protein